MVPLYLAFLDTQWLLAALVVVRFVLDDRFVLGVFGHTVVACGIVLVFMMILLLGDRFGHTVLLRQWLSAFWRCRCDPLGRLAVGDTQVDLRLGTHSADVDLVRSERACTAWLLRACLFLCAVCP